MSNISGIFLGEDFITTLNQDDLEVTTKTVVFCETEYYMRRKNKAFMRDKHGNKLSFTCEELPVDITTLKYGTIVKCRFETA